MTCMTCNFSQFGKIRLVGHTKGVPVCNLILKNIGLKKLIVKNLYWSKQSVFRCPGRKFTILIETRLHLKPYTSFVHFELKVLEYKIVFYVFFVNILMLFPLGYLVLVTSAPYSVVAL
jgi:hypothetical protein